MNKIKYSTLSENFLKLKSEHAYTFYGFDKSEINISPEDFKTNVLKVLKNLQNRGIRPGNEVVFQIKDNLDFAYAFWACVLGRFIPVPYNYLASEREKSNLLKIWRGLKTPFLITDKKSFEQYMEYFKKNNLMRDFPNIDEKTILTEEMNQAEADPEIVIPSESDIAYVQFSSGSTSDPKGIILTHKNMISNMNAIINILQISEKDVFLSWLPFTHNFGLIGMFILPLLAGVKHYIMPTSVFVSNPFNWLNELDKHKVTVSASPNFGLKHVCKYLAFQRNNNLDLSSLRIILNGAEPVSTKVCDDFIDAMKEFGMKDTVIRPSYGMSEATFGITTPRAPERIKEVNILRNNINIGEKVIERAEKSVETVSFVEVGSNIECEINIVDNDGNKLDDRTVGIIKLKGDNIAQKYYYNPNGSLDITDENGWLDTGDVGFLRDDCLVITGRKKDIIFAKGVNFYSHDIENICEEINNGDFKRIAVCGVYSHEKKEDEVYCFVECDKDDSQFEDIKLRIKQNIVKRIGIGITEIVKVGSIPVTASGKLQRNVILQSYLKNKK